MADLARMTQTALKEASNATSKDGALSDPKKLAAAGVSMVALPIVVEQIAKRVAPKVSELGGQAKGKASEMATDAVSSIGDQAKQAAKGAAVSKLKPGSSEDEGGGLLSKLKPGSSDQGDDDEQGRAAPGHGGSGRRMPIQQSVDVAVPIKVAYNRWTLFEDWPEFMHRFECGPNVPVCGRAIRCHVDQYRARQVVPFINRLSIPERHDQRVVLSV